MDLKKVIENSQDSFDSITDPTLLQSFSKFEQYVDEAYEGRLFFELIQNARDAAFEANSKSKIKIIVEGGKVLFANTGKPFDEKGILAMTRLGLSGKDEKEYIGHKGIGFKAIQEFSKTPKVVTEFGTIYFNRNELKDKLDKKFPGKFKKEDSIPLFYHPFFGQEVNTDFEERLQGRYDTVVEFQLDYGKTEEDIVNLYKRITDEELILLGYIDSINFQSDGHLNSRKFTEISKSIYQISSNQAVKKFMVFAPIQTIKIPDSVFNMMETKEKELFEKDRKVDIKIVFELDKHNNIIKNDQSKLFLFYPLELHSGFPYIIHSYFSCNPERTTIRDTELNKFLFEQIAIMQTESILSFLKKNTSEDKLMDFLSFERKSEKLKVFQALYIEKLSQKEFMWLENKKKYITPSQAILCTKEEYDLFGNHKFDNRYLVHAGSSHRFLRENFGIGVLSKTDILNSIEDICELEKSKTPFFSQLYLYCITNEIKIFSKKVLLNINYKLFSSEDDVFYMAKNQVKVPTEISDHLISLHNSIKIDPENLAKYIRLVGIKDFRTAEVVDKALELMENNTVDRFKILVFLKELTELTDITKKNIAKKILLPIRPSYENIEAEWISPMYNPVYLRSDELTFLYPEANYIDTDIINYTDSFMWKDFLKSYGAWDIPAMYIVETSEITEANHVAAINLAVNKSSYAYSVQNDRRIDFPKNPDYFFYTSILENWNLYLEKIKFYSPQFLVKSAMSVYNDKPENFPKLTSLIHILRKNAWIFVGEEQIEPYVADEIFGLNRIDALAEKHLLKNLKIFVIDYHTGQKFIDMLGIVHFNGYSVFHNVSILRRISNLFNARNGSTLDADFKKLYHSALKYLYYAYIKPEVNRDYLLRELKQTKYLCKQIIEGIEMIQWEFPQSIYLIDERLTYEQLSPEAKALLKYYFTKSDKNEIGKIFSKIGKNLSQEVITDVQAANLIGQFDFISLFDNAPYIILAVEDMIEDHLSEVMFQKLKSARVLFYTTLEKEVSLQSVSEYSERRPLKFYYDAASNSIQVSSAYYPLRNNKNVLGEILDHFFSVITGKELGSHRLFKDLMSGISTHNFKEALNDVEFDVERLYEIRSVFTEKLLSGEQLFWGAVLFSKGDFEVDLSIADGKIDIAKLQQCLDSDTEVINQWYVSINYDKFNASENLPIIREIVRKENISLTDINLKLTEPISFEYLFRQQFNKHKNKLANGIKYSLYQFYINKDISIQKSFISSLNNFEKMEPRIWEEIIIDYDVEKSFVEEMKITFPGFDIDLINLMEDSSDWKLLVDDLQRRVKRLKSLIKKAQLNLSNYESFILNESHYSLLYFDKFDDLIKMYEDLFPKENDDETDEPLNISPFSVAEPDEKEIISSEVKTSDVGNIYNPLEEAANKINSGKHRGGGFKSASLPNQDYIKHIGKEGEKLVYQKLSAKYGQENITWVSENAICLNFVPDKEAVGYDMRYIDEHDETHYVEVKSSTGDEPEFYISINEVRSAKLHGKNYHVIWIKNIFAVLYREYVDLHNMFIDYEEGEDFFHNGKFYPQLTGFKIIFRQENAVSNE